MDPSDLTKKKITNYNFQETSGKLLYNYIVLGQIRVIGLNAVIQDGNDDSFA